jgi:hypothetical protein
MRRLLLGLLLAVVVLAPTVASAQGYGPYPRRAYYGYRGYPPYRYGYYRPPVVPYYAPVPYPVYGPPVYPAPVPVYGAPGVGVGISTPGFGVRVGF